MSKLLLQLLGAIEGFESAIIKERQCEGIAARKARGLPVGAKQKFSHDQIAGLKKRIASGEQKASATKHFGISRPTLCGYLS